MKIEASGGHLAEYRVTASHTNGLLLQKYTQFRLFLGLSTKLDIERTAQDKPKENT